jgi:hypothetical protein
MTASGLVDEGAATLSIRVSETPSDSRVAEPTSVAHALPCMILGEADAVMLGGGAVLSSIK